MTAEQYRLARRDWEAKRRAAKRERHVETVKPQIVYRKSGGICGICLLPVASDKFEVDHVVPLSRGGEHSYANTQAAHKSCNRRKYVSMPTEAFSK